MATNGNRGRGRGGGPNGGGNRGGDPGNRCGFQLLLRDRCSQLTKTGVEAGGLDLLDPRDSTTMVPGPGRLTMAMGRVEVHLQLGPGRVSMISQCLAS